MSDINWVKRREAARADRADRAGTEAQGPREDSLDLSAMRAALPEGSYDDEALDIRDFLGGGDDMPAGYPDYVRAKRIVEVCSAAHLALLIDGGLVGNRDDFSDDPDTSSEFLLSLLEYVMPDLEKMRVCLERGDIDMHSCFYANDGPSECFDRCYSEDKICAYLVWGGGDPCDRGAGESPTAGLELLLAHCDYNPIYTATLAAACDLRVSSPETFEFLDEMRFAPPLGTADAPVGFARIGKVLAAQRARRALQIAFLCWLERAGTFGPNGVGFKRDRALYESGALLA